MPSDFERSKGNYEETVSKLFRSLDMDTGILNFGQLNPFDIAFDFLNKSPRLGAESLQESLIQAGVTSNTVLPPLLQNVELKNISRAYKWYLHITEPLVKDPIFILISNKETEVQNKINHAKSNQLKNQYKDELKKIQKEKADYISYMEKNRITLLQDVRDDFIEKLKAKSNNKKINAILDDLKKIRRQPGMLETRADCLEQYGVHQNLINQLEKLITQDDRESISFEDLKNLRNLCCHHNDAAYMKPAYFTSLEIFFSTIKTLVPIIGVVMMIGGIVGFIPSLGASGAMIATGVALVLSVGVIEGIGHSIHAAYRQRAPDFVRIVMMSVSIVMGLLAFITAGVGPVVAASVQSHAAIMGIKASLTIAALFPSAIARQLYNSPRQTAKQFLLNLFDMPLYSYNLFKRVSQTTKYYESNPGKNQPVITDENKVTSQNTILPVAKNDNRIKILLGKAVAASAYNFIVLAQAFLTVFIKENLHHTKNRFIHSWTRAKITSSTTPNEPTPPKATEIIPDIADFEVGESKHTKDKQSKRHFRPSQNIPRSH